METEKVNFKRAVLWEPVDDGKVRCHLCSWRCLVSDGNFGYCRVRKNIGGVLYSLNYDRICAANADPIEKKPLFHFQPGSRSFSVACVGCNFRCEFCQNWQISQTSLESRQGCPHDTGSEGHDITPEQLVTAAIDGRCSSMAYTYTEPTIFMELCDECGRLAKERGITNIFVSNGYETHEAIDFAADWLDAINIDIKAFSDDYYKRLCKASLEPVLDTIKYIAKETDIWMELTTLIVPGENDSDDELKALADFIVAQAGPDVPWHISRFYPSYHMDDKGATPIPTLERAARIAKEAGLRYIYLGNVPGSKLESTYCGDCGKLQIERIGYRIAANKLVDGCCDCGCRIAGVF